MVLHPIKIFSKIYRVSHLISPHLQMRFSSRFFFSDYYLFVEVDLAFDLGQLSIHDVQVNHQGELQSQYKGNAILEFLV